MCGCVGFLVAAVASFSRGATRSRTSWKAAASVFPQCASSPTAHRQDILLTRRQFRPPQDPVRAVPRELVAALVLGEGPQGRGQDVLAGRRPWCKSGLTPLSPACLISNVYACPSCLTLLLLSPLLPPTASNTQPPQANHEDHDPLLGPRCRRLGPPFLLFVPCPRRPRFRRLVRGPATTPNVSVPGRRTTRRARTTR